jgi:hypothetical protein
MKHHQRSALERRRRPQKAKPRRQCIEIAAWGVFDRALTNAEILQLERHLSERTGIPIEEMAEV